MIEIKEQGLFACIVTYTESGEGFDIDTVISEQLYAQLMGWA